MSESNNEAVPLLNAVGRVEGKIDMILLQQSAQNTRIGDIEKTQGEHAVAIGKLEQASKTRGSFTSQLVTGAIAVTSVVVSIISALVSHGGV